MNSTKTAFVFPAFVSEYLGNEIDIIRNLSGDFDAFLSITTACGLPEFKDFSLANETYIQNELYSQISSYLFGCSMAKALIDKAIIPELLAGNSMGLYAALYCSGAVSFEDGLKLIRKAYELIQLEIKGEEMGMGAIVGLELKDMEKIVEQLNNGAFIANKNGEYSYLISGRKERIEEALALAKNEGTLFTSKVLVRSPYHTEFIKNAALQLGSFIDQQISINEPQVKIISSVDQLELMTPNQIREELIDNIYHPINWYASMVHMIENGTDRFIECGAGNTLTKLARFIKGDFKVYPINKINKLVRIIFFKNTGNPDNNGFFMKNL
ncbi:MAG: ACP S-malonyltransferase [Bacteroidales bacterium]